MAKLEISGAETDENCAWRQEKAHLESHRGWIGKNNPTLNPHQTRTKPEQVPNKFRPSSAAKIAKKNKKRTNPNETRTSPEQVPNKSGPLKHCKQRSGTKMPL
jgi:hypothetical protein